MPKARILLAGLLVLALVNYSIWSKEQQLEHGQVMHLQLAPVDPRSLMQGDYMALNYAITSDIQTALTHQAQGNGQVDFIDERHTQFGSSAAVVTLDEQSVARFLRLHDEATALAPGEYLLRFRVRNGQLKFATNAYFFEEGTAGVYESAAFGRFRVSKTGDPLLTHLTDANLNILGADSP
jgi:uncharacterized membrane-anchored protein